MLGAMKSCNMVILSYYRETGIHKSSREDFFFFLQIMVNMLPLFICTTRPKVPLGQQVLFWLWSVGCSQEIDRQNTAPVFITVLSIKKLVHWAEMCVLGHLIYLTCVELPGSSTLVEESGIDTSTDTFHTWHYMRVGCVYMVNCAKCVTTCDGEQANQPYKG